VYFEVESDGETETVESFNHTSNQSKMIGDVFGQPYLWDRVEDGMPATEFGAILKEGLKKIANDRDQLDKWDTPNSNCGSGESCFRFLKRMYVACVRHPYTTVRVWR
jgi:hypothetical protein